MMRFALLSTLLCSLLFRQAVAEEKLSRRFYPATLERIQSLAQLRGKEGEPDSIRITKLLNAFGAALPPDEALMIDPLTPGFILTHDAAGHQRLERILRSPITPMQFDAQLQILRFSRKELEAIEGAEQVPFSAKRLLKAWQSGSGEQIFVNRQLSYAGIPVQLHPVHSKATESNTKALLMNLHSSANEQLLYLNLEGQLAIDKAPEMSLQLHISEGEPQLIALHSTPSLQESWAWILKVDLIKTEAKISYPIPMGASE